MTANERAKEILKRLSMEYSKTPRTALNFATPFELLAATVLSAQTTDVLVNKVTEGLFKKYTSVEDFAKSTPEALAQDVRSANFYKTKAKNIVNAAKMVIADFKGTVPKTMEELVSLPGVARKTGNIILSGAYGINEGIAVDTHVKRLAFRLGLTMHDDPVKIEQDLMKLAPQAKWGDLSHLLIFHGRAVCQARKPKHDACVLADICPSRRI